MGRSNPTTASDGSNLILCRYNVDTLNICTKEFIIFCCTDSTEIFFPKLRSAALNYNLPSFFTDSYCAGVSNKHCLLTFFIFAETTRPIELKFYMKIAYDRLAKIYTNCSGHMTKMATKPIYSKNP